MEVGTLEEMLDLWTAALVPIMPVEANKIGGWGEIQAVCVHAYKCLDDREICGKGFWDIDKNTVRNFSKNRAHASVRNCSGEMCCSGLHTALLEYQFSATHKNGL